MSFVIIDNYDSFTYNLVHLMGELGVKLSVYRNDKITPKEIFDLEPEGIVLSPGPCTPNEAGICLETIRKADGQMPILGVCLGHQAIGQAYGGTVVRAPALMHGKVSRIQHDGNGVFRGINGDVGVTRYHSLTIAPATVPDCLDVNARSDDGTIMGVMHRSAPVHGVQFHPESIASEHGKTMLQNFIETARRFWQVNKAAAV